LLHQQLWVWYLWIVSPCPEQVDWMWTSVGGGDGRDDGGNDRGSGNGKDSGSGIDGKDGGNGRY
jgi:hypothetical protein